MSTSKEKVRAMLRRMLVDAVNEAPDVGFIVIGTTAKGEPRVLHNYETATYGYRVMEALVEQFHDGTPLEHSTFEAAVPNAAKPEPRTAPVAEGSKNQKGVGDATK